MKRFLLGALIVLAGSVWCTQMYAQMNWFVDGKTILTNKKDDVIGAEIDNTTDSWRDGTKLVGNEVGSAGREDIYYEEINDSQTAFETTADFIRQILNYFLGLAGLVALIYLMYHGFLALTAGGDDEKLKKGMEGVKYAMFAIIGVAIAWFFISIVFWLITILAEST